MKYRLQFFTKDEKVLSIDFGTKKDKRKMGDCFIRAISEKTDVKMFNQMTLQDLVYSDPMTIGEAKVFVNGKGKAAVGKDMKRCLGLSLEDSKNKKVFFKKPLVY